MEEKPGKAAIAGATVGAVHPMITRLEESSLESESIRCLAPMRSVCRLRQDESISDGGHH
ncbi:MAG: hypothetical protein PVH30_00915 [Desulfobacterales bacterium]|jgi:hypothetical protein